MAWWNFWRTQGGGKEVHRGIQDPGPTPPPAVTFDTAMQVSAFWACVRILTDTVSAMPLQCFDILEDDSRVKNNKNDIFRLLNYKPNRYQTRVEFFQSLMINLCSSGNFYAFRQYSGRRLIGLLPMASSQVTPVLKDDGSIVYEFVDANGKTHYYDESDVWHVKLFGNGIVGLSAIKYAAKSIQTAIIQDERSQELAKNGGKVSGYIKTPDGFSLTAEQRNAVQSKLQNMVSGSKDFLPILEFGLEFIPTSLSPSYIKLLYSLLYSV